MGWLALLKAALGIANWLAKKAHDKQLISAGEHKAIAESTQKHLKNLAKARTARIGVDHSSDSVHSDPNNRDNTG